MKAKYAGIFSAVLGSICCVGPLLLIALGLGTFAAVIGRYHWFFTGAAMAVLAWAWVKHFREQARCACEHRATDGSGSSSVTLIVASAIVVGFAALNVSSLVFTGSPSAVAATTNTNLQRIAIPVEGMSCATCEIGVRYALKSVNGVESAHVSAATKTATVDYDPAKTNPQQLVAAINSTGYRATVPREMSSSTNKIAHAESGQERNITMDPISLFKVSLECPAAPKIGCGTASKPILLQLEQEAGVAEAWLNRAGTQIAVVWKPESAAAARRNVAAKLTDDAREIQGEPRDEALKSFLSGKGWYHGADADRLSEEEAGIIAARLIRRVQAKTPLQKDKAEGLKLALTQNFSKSITGDQQNACRLDDIAGIASKYLNQDQLKIFKEAVQSGVRPLPNES
jgi:copper chaperone CopZ